MAPNLRWNKTRNVHIEVRSCNHCCSGKSTISTYSKCLFVALGIEHAMSMRHVVNCDMAGSTIFVHIILQTAGLAIKKSLNIQCVVMLSANVFWNISHSTKKWARFDHKWTWILMYSTRYSCQIFTKLEISRHFSKNNQIYNFMKICQWEPSCCMQTDGRTDRHDEANRRFSQNFENRLKMVALYRGLTLFGETPILCLNILTSKWPFSCQFEASTSHLSQLNLCYDTVQSGKAVWTTTPFKA